MLQSFLIYIPFLIPNFTNNQFIGYAVTNPHAIPIAIINQNAGIAGVKCKCKQKLTIADQPYMPTCQAVSDQKSILNAWNSL